jgi:hypothetical protein
VWDSECSESNILMYVIGMRPAETIPGMVGEGDKGE